MKIQSEDVVKVALGKKELPDVEFSAWENTLAEIIVGDAFGVDRMDYLLRDSYHAGVAYGRFDHYRLIDTLRILPRPPSGEGTEEEEGYALGVEEGGIQSAEALMLARYFMYSQVYFHKIRRIYDIHLKDFLKAWLPKSVYPTDIEEHLAITDTEVTAAMRKADHDSSSPGHVHASRIVQREHFKCVYSRHPNDAKINPEAGLAIYRALCERFGEEHFRHDRYSQKGSAPDFPVLLDDGRVASSLDVSEVLVRLPVINVDYVFAEQEFRDEAEKLIRKDGQQIIKPLKEEEKNG